MSERDIHARLGGTLTEAKDLQARHDGELKPAQSAYVRQGGELVQVWPRPSAIPDSGLIHRYRLNDDSTASTAVDSEGSNDGVINDGTYTTTAAEGSHALDLSGNGSVDLGTGIFDTSSSFSVSLVVNFNSLGSDQRLFTTRSDVNTLLSQGRVAADSVEIWSDANEWQIGSVSTGTHIPLGYSYDAGTTTLKGIINGSVGVEVTHEPTSGSGQATAIGSGTALSSNFSDAIVDDALLYNRVLSDSEWSQIHGTY